MALCSGSGAAQLRFIGSKAAVAVAVAIVLVACGSNSSSGQGPLHLPSHGSSNSSAGWKDFIAQTSPTGAWTSGCPSPACSDILAQLQEGTATRTVPPDLTPTLEEESKDTQPGAPRYQLQAPPGGNCSDLLPVSGLVPAFQPCVFEAGAPPTAPSIMLIGNSRALMWSRSVLALATRLGYRFGFVQHEGCSMVRVEDNSPSNSAVECKNWEDAAINWVNQQNPAMVLVSSGPDLNQDWKLNGKTLTPAELTKGYAAALKELAAPARKVFVIGEVPALKEDAPRCLAANESSALKCATAASEAISADENKAGVDAAQQAGAGYVNITPWLCTEDLCPAIIGHYLAYRDQRHLSTVFTEALSPVLEQAMNIGHA
jgi:SGNH domain (fused to AT3 domains)